ncbi:cytochrome b5-like heme/steroid binding domain-containing protein [Suillus spraguei]|nr:cytochrome b5-like heme/steroid binding domain-containing protein [Suillus spraguei]KAG2361427.1 cytochrome b5-like heme/steroid binding domain-containing protein [Suillus spraguei]
MPPPPVPSLVTRQPGVPPPESSLFLLAPMTTNQPPRRPFGRDKAALAPGFGPVDRGNFKAFGQNLRLHNKNEDAWTAINEKVYNITPHLSYYLGGEKELMRVAGRDGTKLFSLTHAWVNADFMLDACLVGFLVSEPSS